MRILSYVFLVAALLLLTVASALAFLIKTDPGRDFLVSRIEPILGERLGGAASIGDLGPGFPRAIVIEDVRLSDRDGVFAEIGRAEMDWRPFALMSRAVRIQRLEIADARLLRAPNLPENQDAPSEPERPALPTDLPTIEVDALRLVNFRYEGGDAPVTLNGEGRASIGGARIDLALRAASDAGADDVDLTALVDENEIALDGRIASAPSGVIAGLVGLTEPLDVTFRTTEPAPSRHAVLIDGAIGDFGDVEAQFNIRSGERIAFAARGQFEPGARLGDAPELAAPVRFDLTVDEAGDDLTLEIVEIAAAPGALAGTLVVRLIDRQEVARAVADLRVAFADDYRPDIQDIVGSEIALETEIAPQADEYALTLRARSPKGRVSLTDATSDFSSRLGGDLTLEAQAPEGLPLPPARIRLSSRIDAEKDGVASAESLSLQYGDFGAVSGAAAYDLGAQRFEANADFTMAPALIATLRETLQAEAAISGRLQVAGATDDFSVNGAIASPRMRMNDAVIPKSDIEIDIAGAPTALRGSVRAAPQNTPGRFAIRFASPRKDAIAVESLRYEGVNFALAGEALVDIAAQTLRTDVTYRGDAGATPYPGLPLEGEARLNGLLSRVGQSDLTVAAPRLESEAFQITDLQGDVSGPASDIGVRLQAKEIAASGQLIRELNIAGSGELGDAPALSFSKLEGLIFETRFALSDTARVAFGDGVTIDNFAMNWGRDGRVALEALYAPDRWRADARVSAFVLPNTDAALDLSLDLDTDRTGQIAEGSFELASLTILDEDALRAIGGDFRWNGETLRVVSEPREDGLDLNLTLPVALVREPTLSTQIEGALEGRIDYDGPVSLFAAYLPPDLQTLEGDLDLNATLAGTISEPDVMGSATFTDGALTHLASGLSVSGLNASARARYEGGETVIAFGEDRAADQNGIALTGDARLGADSRLDLTINLNQAEFSAHPVENIILSGAIDVAGPLNDVAATGEVTIEELNAAIVVPESTGLVDIEVVNIEEAQNRFEEQQPAASSFSYDIRVLANNRIFVRGRGLESEWAADLRARSIDGAPIVTGSVNIERGYLDFSGRRFDITTGRISFDRLSANNPLLDIVATLETTDVTANIEVSGRAQAPEVALTSTPALPQEDVMAIVLFGKPASELSETESVQSALALAQLGGVGPFGGGGGGVIGSLRQATGLDLLSFDAEGGGGSVTVGKYLADGFFVTATQGTEGQSAVRLEYEVTRSISVETEINQEGEQTVSANWKRDF